MIADSEELDLIFAELERGEPLPTSARSPGDEFLDDVEFDEAHARDRSGDDDVPDDADHAAAVTTSAAATPIERLTGLVAALSLTLWLALVQGAHLGVLFEQVWPFAMVSALAFGGLVMSHGPRATLQAFGVPFGQRADDAAHADRLRSLLRRGRRLSYAGALLQFVVSAVCVCQRLDTPDRIAATIAPALSAIVFAVLLAELGFGAAVHWVRAVDDSTETDPDEVG